MGADLAAQSQRFTEGREQQLDSSGIEADAVVQDFDAIFFVNAADRHHSFEDAFILNLCRISGEERVQHVWCRAFDDEVDPVSRDIDTRELVNDLIDLENDDALIEFRRFDDRRGVLCGKAGVNVAGCIRIVSADEGNSRHEVDEVAGIHFKVGMDSAEFDTVILDHLRQTLALAACISEVQLSGDAFIKDIQMLRNGEGGLDHMKIMHFGRIHLAELFREEIRLFLVIAFDIDFIARAKDRFKDFDGIGCVNDLSLCIRSGSCNACCGIVSSGVPVLIAWFDF